MVSFVRGKLSAVYDGKIELDTGGIGYEISVTADVLGRLPALGQEMTVYTYLNVKEDEMSLFGFGDRDAQSMFRKLITVSGIGPKGALAILSSMSVSDLRFAIMAGDAKTISKAPGIGAKTAQKLCIELKDKISLEDTLGFTAVPSAGAGAGVNDENKADAILALTSLGYSSADAMKAVQAIDCTDKSTEEILKLALKTIGF